MRFIENCTNEELVAELVKRQNTRGGLQDAPRQTVRATEFKSITIALGTDETADLTIPVEGLAYLEEAGLI